jgi:hypothetical protein
MRGPALAMSLCVSNKHKEPPMISGKNVLVLGLILGLSTPVFTFAKNGVKSEEVIAEKAAKEAAKVEKKAAKDAEKSAKKAAQETEKAAKELAKVSAQGLIDLKAKMKQEEAVDDANEVDVDVPENEASLRYRVKGDKHKLTAEIEGFSDGDIFKMYVVINSAEILVSEMELVGDGTIPAQEVEFDDATWPTNLPLDLPSGTTVRVRDSQGAIVLEGVLASK